MTKLYTLVFMGMTLVAGYLTYNDVGMQDKNFSSSGTSNSIRTGSSGIRNGYRYGK